jgi:hypothetical protein
MELPLNTLEDAIKQGRITIASQDLWNQNRELVHERLSRASESDLKIATERCGIVSRFLRGERDFSVPLRTVRRWVSAHQIAEDQLGSGYLGLLPGRNAGNAVRKLPESTRSLMTEFLENDYETLKQKTQYTTWCALRLACERQGIVAPSFKTFSLAIRQRPGFEQTLKRKGHGPHINWNHFIGNWNRLHRDMETAPLRSSTSITRRWMCGLSALRRANH